MHIVRVVWFCHLLPFLVALPLSASAQVTVPSYAPSFTTCPGGFQLVRDVGGPPSCQRLSNDEEKYVRLRRTCVLPDAWKSYLKNVEGTQISLPDYVSKILGGNTGKTGPNLGIATSGGGYRAAIFGAGVLNILDGRNETSASGGTGGLLQVATYITGVSGSAWLVTSLAQANFPTMEELIFGSADRSAYAGWLTDLDILNPSENATIAMDYIKSLLGEMEEKFQAGFAVTTIDLWARGLSRHFLNGTTRDNMFNPSIPHGAGITFSDIANVPSFRSYSQPFPIIVADLQGNNQNLSNIQAVGDEIPLSNPIIEFNIFETGSFDPILSAFTPTRYLGTQNTSTCVSGFDQASFVAAASSAFFNSFNSSTKGFAGTPIASAIALVNATFPQPGVELDTAQIPNSFFGVAPDTFIFSNETILNVVDGGEDGEVIPLQPLLVKAREVDVILAIDASADELNFADGESLIAAKNRSSLFPSTYTLPPIPSSTLTFTSQGLTTHPTFFGCDTDANAPLVIYIANGGPPLTGEAPVTNTSTLQTRYSLSEVRAMLDQTNTMALQGRPQNAGSSPDPEWPACLACAIVDRARYRIGESRSGVCSSCFSRYCWNGTETTR